MGLEYALDPTIASINFYRATWDFAGVEILPIISHECTQEELGMEGSNSRFFPVTPDPEQFKQYFAPGVFKCIDDEDLSIRGSYSSFSASIIYVKLEKCNGQEEGYCKSDEEIKNFLLGKNLAILSNRIRFDQTRYGADSIRKESVVEWIPISTVTKEAVRMQIMTT